MEDLCTISVSVRKNVNKEIVASMIEIKQGWLLFPSLFSFYVDEISNYIEKLGCFQAWLARVAILILLYLNDIVLISDTLGGL